MPDKNFEGARDELLEMEEKLQSEVWDLITKLNSAEYDHPTDQYDDMKRIGDLAEKIETVRETKRIEMEMSR